MLKIDKILRYKERCQRIQTGALLFGPTGDRLFAETLEKKPGFVGRIDFIHKINITSLFEVCCSTNPDFDTGKAVWYPSHMTFDYADEDIVFHEVKYITKDDTAVSWQKWENRSKSPITLTLRVQAEQCHTEQEEDGTFYLETPMTAYGFRVGAAVGSNFALEKRALELVPGQIMDFMVAASAVNLETETRQDVVQKVRAYLKQSPVEEIIYERYQEQYNQFFQETPSFESSDEMLNHTWMYRWFILRHCMAKPNFGYLRHTVEYEGRSHKVSKVPFERKGWEFTKLIPLSTPLHLTDLRWHQDQEQAHEIARSFFSTADENGIARTAYVHEYGKPYANYMVWAVYKLYLADGDLDFVREMLPAMVRFVEGHVKVYGNPSDLLQIEEVHQRTGKEYQPSYWYFHRDENGEYPKNPKDTSRYTPLKRVDRSVYHYLNLKGLSAMCRLTGDQEGSQKYQQMAERLSTEINEKMWDPETDFYYDLHFQTDEKAMVKNIVGIYPYWAEIAGDRERKGILRLFDQQHFAAGSAFASVSRECPAYRPMGSWMGNFIKGRDGCVWCGPSWPYTTGIALDAAARQSKREGHAYDNEFGKFLRQYCIQHFRDGVLERPYLVEHYNAKTGEPLSDDADYNHSYWLDLVITHVCGLEAGEQELTIDPIDIGLKYFKLDGVNIRGKRYGVFYSKGRDRKHLGLEKGFTVTRDGETVFHSEELAKTVLPLE